MIGTGTLVVNSAVQTGGDVGAAGAPLTFNIVATGNFQANDKFYLNGSAYVGGTMGFNNLTVLTGVIVANGQITLNNHHTFIMGSPPSFDPPAQAAWPSVVSPVRSHDDARPRRHPKEASLHA